MKQYDKIFIPLNEDIARFLEGIDTVEEQSNMIVLTKEEFTKIVISALFESKDITVEEFFENLNNKR